MKKTKIFWVCLKTKSGFSDRRQVMSVGFFTPRSTVIDYFDKWLEEMRKDVESTTGQDAAISNMGIIE